MPWRTHRYIQRQTCRYCRLLPITHNVSLISLCAPSNHIILHQINCVAPGLRCLNYVTCSRISTQLSIKYGALHCLVLHVIHCQHLWPCSMCQTVLTNPVFPLSVIQIIAYKVLDINLSSECRFLTWLSRLDSRLPVNWDIYGLHKMPMRM